MRRMLDEDISGKRRRERPNLTWKDACKRDMTEAGLKENNTTIPATPYDRTKKKKNGDRCTGPWEVTKSNSISYPLRIWPAKG